MNKNLEICVVEDDAIVRKTLNRILKYIYVDTDTTIDTFATYEELMESNKNYDVGFYDYDNVFGINGNKFFDDHPNYPGRRVLMSGLPDNWKPYTGIHLNKPFTIDDIQMCLD